MNIDPGGQNQKENDVTYWKQLRLGWANDHKQDAAAHSASLDVYCYFRYGMLLFMDIT